MKSQPHAGAEATGPTQPSSGNRAGRPLSFNQEEMLQSVELFRLSTSSYLPLHFSGCFRLRINLNPDVLQRALNQVVERHAGLRAAFFPAKHLDVSDRRRELLKGSATHVACEHLYLQSIAPSAPPALEFQRLTAAPEQRQEEIQELTLAFHSRPFDLEQPPLMRAALIHCGPEDYYFLLVVHHLLIDLWSHRILRKDLAHFYDDSFQRRPALPELRAHYPDFAEWQRTRLVTAAYAESVEYWRRNWLALEREQIAAGDFPAARLDGRTPAASGSSEVRLEPELSRRVRDAARRARVSLYSFLLAAFVALLHFWTRKSFVVTRINLANRVRPEMSEMLGFVANTHFIAVDVSSDPDGRQLLQQVNRTILNALKHQEVPLCLAWRALGRPPIVGRMRILFDMVAPDASRAGLPDDSSLRSQLRPLQLDDSLRPKASGNLHLAAVDSEEMILLTAVFSHNGWNMPILHEFLRDYQTILEALTSQQDLHLSALSGSLALGWRAKGSGGMTVDD